MTGRTFWIVVGAGLATGGIVFAGAMKSPLMGLAGVMGIVGLLAVIREPGLGMGVLTFLFPLERMQRITSDDATFTISIMRIVALACLMALVLQRVHQRRSLRVDSSMLFYGIYVGLAIAGLTYTTDPYGTKRFLGTILSNCLLVFLYYNYLQTRKQIQLTLAIWLAANVVGAAYTAYDFHRGSGAEGAQRLNDPSKGGQTVAGRWSTVWEDITEFDRTEGAGVRRSMGPTSHPSVYGINLVMTVPYFFYLLRRHRRLWQQAGLMAAFGLIAYNIMLTNTRATFLATLLVLVLSVGMGLVPLRRGYLVAGLVVFLALVPAVPQDLLKRMLDPGSYTTQHSKTLSIRLQYWEAATRILQDHFMFGQGVGNEKVVPAYLPDLDVPLQSVHNIYLQIAVETGILGWLGFFTFVGLMFHYARLAARTFRQTPGWEAEAMLLVAVQVMMLVVLGYGLQVDVFNFPLKGWWLMTTASLILYRWSQSLPGSAPVSAAGTPVLLQPVAAR